MQFSPLLFTIYLWRGDQKDKKSPPSKMGACLLVILWNWIFCHHTFVIYGYYYFLWFLQEQKKYCPKIHVCVMQTKQRIFTFSLWLSTEWISSVTILIFVLWTNDKYNMICFTQISSKTKNKLNIFFVDKTQTFYFFISCEADVHYYWESLCVIF